MEGDGDVRIVAVEAFGFGLLLRDVHPRGNASGCFFRGVHPRQAVLTPHGPGSNSHLKRT